MSKPELSSDATILEARTGRLPHGAGVLAPGDLLAALRLNPDPDARRRVLWTTPSRLFGFGARDGADDR